MAFWNTGDKKGETMKKGTLRKIGRAARRAFRPAMSGFLALTMLVGSVPAPAYAEMMEEAAHAVWVMQNAQAERAATDEQAAGAAAGDEAGAAEGGAASGVSAGEDAVPAEGTAAQDGASGEGATDADLGADAPAADFEGAPAGDATSGNDAAGKDGASVDAAAQQDGAANAGNVDGGHATTGDDKTSGAEDVDGTDAAAAGGVDAAEGEAADADSKPAGQKQDNPASKALFTKSDDLMAVTLGGDALASRANAIKALEESGASREDAEAAADTLLGRGNPFAGFFASPAKGEAPAAASVDVKAEWLTESDGAPSGMQDADGQITVRPDGDGEQTLRLRVSYALSGEHDYDPGMVSITVPGNIFKTRDQEKTGRLVLPVPAEPAQTAGWNYRHVVKDGVDEYVITNTHQLSAGAQGIMEFAFAELIPHKMADMANSDAFVAKVELTTRTGALVTEESNGLKARFDTQAMIHSDSVVKRVSGAPRFVPANSPEVKLAAEKHPDEVNFVVIDWYTTASVEANQTFDLEIVDELQDDHQGVILRDSAKNDAERPSVTITQQGTYFSGASPYNRVSVAYPAGQFESGKKYTFKNKVTYTLTETDEAVERDEQAVTTEGTTTEEEWTCYDPVFIEPGGHFGLYGYGNDSKPFKDTSSNITHSASGASAPDLRTSGIAPLNGYTGLYGAALNSLARGKAIDMSYTLNTVGFTLPWTYAAPQAPAAADNPQADLENYNKTNVTMTTESEGLRIGEEQLKVLKDFEYTNVVLPTAPVIKKATAIHAGVDGTVDFSTHDSGAVEYVADTEAAHIPSVELQVKRSSVDGWESYATASWSAGVLEVAFADGGEQQSAIVPLPSGTTAVRAVTTSNVAGMMYFMRVGVHLNASEKLVQLAKDAFKDSEAPIVPVEHDASMLVQTDANKEIFTMAKPGANKLTGYTTDVRASMTSAIGSFNVDDPSTNDTAHQRALVKMSARVSKKTHITDANAFKAAVESGDLLVEHGGTFYNLLPKGMYPLMATVKLRESDKVRSMYTIENYRGTGRTMLVVSADFTPQMSAYNEGGVQYYQDELQLTFDAAYSYVNIDAYGEEFHNVVAYQSDNNEVGTIDGFRGEPDSPKGPAYNNNGTVSAFRGEDTRILDVMENLDGNDATSEPNTLYAGSHGVVDPISFAETGIFKEVSVNESDWFTAENKQLLNVYAGGSYVYRMGERTQGTELKGLVFYDSIEDCRPGEDTGDSEALRWHGTIQSIDVSQLERMGCEPKVYYSTQRSEGSTGLDFYHAGKDGEVAENTNTTNLDNKEIWTETTPDALASLPSEQRADITAIAVDARTARGGGEFELPADSTAVVLVRMVAPDGEEAAGYAANNAYAFNDVCVKSVIPANGESVFQHKGYTKLGIAPYSLEVEKTWEDDNDRDRKRPESIEVQLTANGAPVDGKTLTLSENQGWTGAFENLSHLDAQGNKIVYNVVETNLPEGYHAGTRLDGTTLKLVNTHEPERVSVSGTKTWQGDTPQDRPAKIEVSLLANGKVVDSKTVRPGASEEDVWTYSFDNLLKNDEQGNPISYTIDENLLDERSYVPRVDGYDIVNVHRPYGDLVISNTTEGNTTLKSKDKEFTFTLALTKEGTPVFGEFAYEVTGAGIDPNAPVRGTIATNGTVTLKGGQTARIKNLPEDASYTVTEAELPGFDVQGSSRVTGAIIPNAENKAEFLNVYSSSVDVNFEAVKRLEGRELAANRFAFELVAPGQGEGAAEQVVRTVTNKAPKGDPTVSGDGTVSHEADVVFGALTYTQQHDGKTFTYTMRESTESGRGYTCDTSEYTAQVTLMDEGDGTMSAEVAYTDSEGNPLDKPPVFENTYTAAGELFLQARKTLKGGDLTDGQFAFEVGKVLEKDGVSTFEKLAGIEGTNDANGLVEFPAIQYTQQDVGEHLYAIREVVDDAAEEQGLSYDRHVALVKAAVSDTGAGTLNITTTFDNLTCPCFVCGGDGTLSDAECPACEKGEIASSMDSLEFVNRYADAGLEIQKTLKEGEASDDPNHKFMFELELTNENGEPVEGLDFSESKLVKADEAQGGAAQSGEVELAAVQDTPAKQGDQDNPLAAFGAWAMDSLASLFAPTEAHAAELPGAREIKEGTYGESTYTFDPDSGLLTIDAIGLTHLNHSEALPWKQLEGVISVTFKENSTAGVDLFHLFSGMTELQSVDFTNLDMSRTTNMEGILAGCSSLTEVDLSNKNLESLTMLYGAFDSCSKLETVKLPESLPKLKNMGNVFRLCSSLEKINLSDVNAPEVTTLAGAFDSCHGLAQVSLNLNGFPSLQSLAYAFRSCGKLTDVSLTGTGDNIVLAQMFLGCISLEKIDFSQAKIEASGSMANMFDGCTALKTVQMDGLDTSNVASMASMFIRCSALETVDLTGFDTGSVAAMNSMFSGCTKLKDIKLPEDFTAASVDGSTSGLRGMFQGCSALTSLDLPEDFTTGKNVRLGRMFDACSSLSSVVLPEGFGAQGVADTDYMFSSCTALKEIKLPEGFDTTNATSLQEMFSRCENLTSLKLPEKFTAVSAGGGSASRAIFYECKNLTSIVFGGEFKTAEGANLGKMFSGCSSLTELNLPKGFGAEPISVADSMFENCKSLKSITLPDAFDLSQATTVEALFSHCEQAMEINLPRSFDTSSATNMSRMFAGCFALEKLTLPEGFSAKSANTLESMFYNCNALTELVLPETFDTGDVTSFRTMFYHCESLTGLELPESFDTSNAMKMDYMFEGCTALKSLKLPGQFNTYRATAIKGMFNGCRALESIYLPAAFSFMGAQNETGADTDFCMLPEHDLGDGTWIRVDESTGLPAKDAVPHTPEELKDEFSAEVAGWYAWNTFLTVGFEANGGIGSGADVLVNALKDSELTPPTVVRFGYDLTGWAYDSDEIPLVPGEHGSIELASDVALKLLESSEDGRAVLTALWEKSDDGAGQEQNGVYRFAIPAGYVLDVADVIPSGTSYKVTEVAEDGWKLDSSTGTFGVISSGNDTPSKAEFVNARVETGDPQTVSATIQVGKMLDGVWAKAGDTFSFTMEGYNPEADAEGEWTGKLHDGGVVTFPMLTWDESDLDGEASKVFDYTIREAKGSDGAILYDGSTITATVTVQKGDNGKLTQSVAYKRTPGQGDLEGDGPVFLNRTRPGALEIAKEIEGVGSTSQEFAFMVHVNGKPYVGGYAVGGDMRSTTDGIVKLGGAQTAVISDIPAGSSYSVEEVNIPSGWTQTNVDGNSKGVIAAGDTAAVSITNAYAATGSAQIMAYKSFPGGVLEEGAFSFGMYEGVEVNGAPVRTAKNGGVDMSQTVPGAGGTPVQNPHYRQAPVYFDPIAFSAADVGASHEYVIAEDNLGTPGVTFDSGVYDVTVSVTDNGDGTLSTSVDYDGGEAPVFENKPRSVELDITKVVTNDFEGNDAHKNDEFELDVSLTDATGAPLGEQGYTVVDAEGTVLAKRIWDPFDESGVNTGTGTITLKSGETARFASLPYGAHYAIAEAPKDGWAPSAQGSQGNLSGTLESVDVPTEVNVASVYSASGSVSLKARKDFDGELENGMFTFELAQLMKGGERKLLQEQGNVDKEVTFDELKYSLEDVGSQFTYQLTERNNGDPGVTYDDTVYQIVVAPKDLGNGKLDCTPQITRDGVSVGLNDVVFTNRRAFDLPFTGGGGIGLAGVAVLALGCAAYLIDRTRKRKA